MTFLETARALLDDEAAKAAYAEDPQAFLAERGFDDLDPTDLADAVGFVAESLPVGVARQLLPESGDHALDGHQLLGRLADAEPVADELEDPGGLDDLPPLAGVAAVDALPDEPHPGTHDDPDEEPGGDPDDAPDLAFGQGGDAPTPADADADIDAWAEPDAGAAPPGATHADLRDPDPELGEPELGEPEPEPEPGDDLEDFDDGVADGTDPHLDLDLDVDG